MPFPHNAGGALALLLALHLNAAEDDIARAYRLQQQGSLKEARAVYERAIPGLQSSRDAERLATATRRLAEIDLAEGKYKDAAAHAASCAAIFDKLHLAPGFIACSTALGRVYVNTGDYRQGMTAYSRALALARQMGSGDAEITLLNNIGNIQYFLGRYGEAFRYYRDAESRLAANVSQAWYPRRLRLTLANEAALFQRLGQYDRALDLYTRVRTAPGAMPGSEQAQMTANMGTLYRRLGDPVKAIETYRAADRLFAANSERDGEIGVLKNTGIALALDLHDPSRALDEFQNALQLSERSGNRREIVQVNLYIGETLRRAGRLDAAREHFQASLAEAAAIGDGEDRWKALYGIGRIAGEKGDSETALGDYLEAIAHIESVRSAIAGRPLRTGFLADKRDVYDAVIAILAHQPNPSLDRILGLMEGQRSRTFQDRIGSQDAVTVRSIAGKLGPSDLFLEFWMAGENGAVVWISATGSGVVRLQPPGMAALDRLTAEFSNGAGDQWRSAALEAGQRLLEPIAALGQPAIQHVMIVPDGPLQAIPFEALGVNFAAKPQLLIERCAVSYLPSAKLLRKQHSRPWPLLPWRLDLVAFADPAIRASAGEGAVYKPDLARLPATAQEVRAVASILGGRSELHTGPGDLKRYMAEANLRGVPVLHLSTHAVADMEDPDRSRILFSPENGGTADFLFAREIESLDLTGVRLATLAACDTENGKSIGGEGVQSFGRAFLSAGAESTVGTLWRIGDQPTSEFMTQFYRHLAVGEPVAEALRQAKLAFYRSDGIARHPRYWAAFVLNGDSNTTLPRTIPWMILVTIPLILLAGLSSAVRRRTVTGKRG